MTTPEDYMLRSEASLAAADASTTSGDRQFHMRAHGIWKKLAQNERQVAERAAAAVPAATRKQDKSRLK